MLLVTSVAVVVLTGIAYLLYEQRTFERAAKLQLGILGEMIASNSTAALAFENAEDAEQVLAALQADVHITTAVLYDATGAVFARYPADLPATAYPAHVGPPGPHAVADGWAVFHPVMRQGKRLGTLYLRTDRAAMYERLRLSAGFFAGVIVVTVIVVFVFADTLQRQVSRPILALAATARRIALDRDYVTRAEKYGADEIGVLTDAFNEMVDRLAVLHRELEARVQSRTAALQEANRELEAFSYSVSHDLRAPLRHIGGFATMLEKHAGPTLDEKGRRYVTVILQSTARMGQLIDDLLDFSRHGRAELRTDNVPLDGLVEAVRAGLQSETDGRVVEWQIAPLPAVRGDPALLRQVFLNLLGNAVKYTRRREVARIEIGVQARTAEESVVFVRDNGAGFDMRYVDKLFGVFQRLHHENEFEGTGVGLATVRRIVQRHGGRVWAEGSLDEGATFFVALPNARET